MKLLILGYARHGKDTAAEMFAEMYGLRHVSSSWFCAERVVFPKLAPKYNYTTIQECFDDRHRHRGEWFDLIKRYNLEDPARLGNEIFNDYDMYVGLRNAREFYALKNSKAFDLSVWIHRDSEPAESRNSCTVEPWMADYVIDNSQGLDDLLREIGRFNWAFK